MVRMTKANLKSDNDCRGTLHLRCQLYDKDIFGSEILDFRISGFQDFWISQDLGSGGGDAGRNFGYYTSTFSECSVFLGYSKKWKDL